MTPDTPIRAAVFDIDGTLAMMDKASGTFTALPGAVAALAACRAAGMAVAAYTNGTFFPPEHYYPRLAAAGLDFEPGHILTPASVAAHHLTRMGMKRVMVFGDEGTAVPLRDAGIEVLAPEPADGPVDAVLCGWTRHVDVPKIEAVCNAVWDGAKPFTTSSAPFFAGANGRLLGISGALAAMIHNVTGQEVGLFGKPSPLGLEMIVALTGVSVDAIMVIGDDPELELRMAREAGAFAIGVTTGLHDRAAFNAIEPAARAHVVLEGLIGFADQPWFETREGAT
ncbi:HAD-IIA family hydrolase [Sinisalibacter aestuarii]|uniref:Haloacid dehalogenase n=1 Tax=Sinisalibacter aestuarii TaxID=2949426 RepID=A0ABQ5M035_9RHOB|nr:HAD family hydrolase [Sinisalibacter aestuarii]GKY90130.1 hypothetical protein STA1M1_39990 [Sinisalibacter aestuarii]